MKAIQLVEALKNGTRVYGTCVTSEAAHWAGAAASSGMDFVFIDTEHIPLDRRKLSQMCKSFNMLGIASVVRIPSPDPFEACKVLDGGASGIIAPYVETVEQVKQLVGATKLRPLKGQKLQTLLETGEIEETTREYLAARNKANILIINIESQPALDNLDALASVEGLDCFLIGPHDLSVSLGVPEDYDNPIFEEAVIKICKTARSHGLGVGAHYSEGTDKMISWARKSGMNMMLYSSDTGLFVSKLKESIDEMKSALSDTDTSVDFDATI